ncbi:PACE efflux transporter [Lampropedia puyangensis]|uniref:PACE efflux transporter n=1 Tax=Lampropedia puyangensis TaxID=1330072 RepID=A0A4S8FG43_9BURK|nr:PACE efflux transporter [Lampropedia puyangensis]THU05454.1 PACE efflux transporter [Lampropedia puyangensis]
MQLQGIRRRIVYVTIYEIIAIAVSSWGLAFVSGRGMSQALVAAVAASAIAVSWNYVFNTFFERWEAKQTVKGRSIKRRIAHALGFEGGLIVFLVPLFAWQLNVTLWQAFVMDFGLMVFFLVYTFVFTWCFDRIFGLPNSTQTVSTDTSAENQTTASA